MDIGPVDYCSLSPSQGELFLREFLDGLGGAQFVCELWRSDAKYIFRWIGDGEIF